ncbi:hypothetical protein ACFFWA_27855 [Actinomadura verrucosospora]|uniref:hypothetical protein n=1 Tax=Actinomadura TaxID=1988 RepID=UPI0031E5ED3E
MNLPPAAWRVGAAGRLEQARLHAETALGAGLPGISPRLALITYGALAMTASGEKEAEDMYARAESAPAAAGFPFEPARVRLARGVRLRHVQGPRRAALRDALARAGDS